MARIPGRPQVLRVGVRLRLTIPPQYGDIWLTCRIVSRNTTDGRRFSHRPEPPQPVRSLKIDWEVDVGSLAKGVKHLDSPSYQHKGYHLYDSLHLYRPALMMTLISLCFALCSALQLCREKQTDREGSSVGLYVFANSGPSIDAAGDEGNKPCFLPVTSQITVRNPSTKALLSLSVCVCVWWAI